MALPWKLLSLYIWLCGQDTSQKRTDLGKLHSKILRFKSFED